MFRYKCRVILQLSTRGNKQTPNYGMNVSAIETEPVNKGPYLCGEVENSICKGYYKKWYRNFGSGKCSLHFWKKNLVNVAMAHEDGGANL